MEYTEGVSGPKMDLELEPAPKSADLNSEEEIEEASLPGGQVIDEQAAQVLEREERARRKAESRANAVEKWSHDKFDDEQQMPRSQAELVDRYGFDIRELDPTATDFSRPIATNGTPLEDTLSESSTMKRSTRSTRGKPNGKPAGRMSAQKSTPTRRTPQGGEKAPQIKNQAEFPDLKPEGNGVKKEVRGRKDSRTQEKKPFNKQEPRNKRPPFAKGSLVYILQEYSALTL
jgi:hypothetical protein